VEVLVERSDEVRLGVEEVRVPDAEQTAEDRNVLSEGCVAEVLVHLVAAGQELAPVVVADIQNHAQADGAPYRVAPADPFLKAKHVCRVDAELLDLGLVGRQGDKVLGDVALAARLLEEPGLGRVCVGRRLGRGEGLGSDEEQRRVGIGFPEGLGDVCTVDVGHKVQRHAPVSVVLERFRDHDGAAKEQEVASS
jgi:hypothetical protein